MWVRSSGSLTENVFQLSTQVSTHLLILGEGAALVDCGIDLTAPRLIASLDDLIGKEASIDFLLLTHAHFDHVGGIPALRERCPEMEVIAAPQTAELLSDPAYVRDLYARNLSCAAAVGAGIGIEESRWLELCKADRIIGDGDSIDLGDGVEVKLLSCPGHTKDSVAYFVIPDSALAAGESIGSYGGRDVIVNCFTDNFNDYIKSLSRLSGLDVKVLGFPHSGALTGEIVPRYFMGAMQGAENFQRTVKERIEHGELIDEIVASMLPEWQEQNISPEGPFVSMQEETLRQMVRAAAQTSPESS